MPFFGLVKASSKSGSFILISLISFSAVVKFLDYETQGNKDCSSQFPMAGFGMILKPVLRPEFISVRKILYGLPCTSSGHFGSLLNNKLFEGRKYIHASTSFRARNYYEVMFSLFL